MYVFFDGYESIAGRIGKGGESGIVEGKGKFRIAVFSAFVMAPALKEEDKTKFPQQLYLAAVTLFYLGAYGYSGNLLQPVKTASSIPRQMFHNPPGVG